MAHQIHKFDRLRDPSVLECERETKTNWRIRKFIDSPAERGFVNLSSSLSRWRVDRSLNCQARETGSVKEKKSVTKRIENICFLSQSIDRTFFFIRLAGTIYASISQYNVNHAIRYDRGVQNRVSRVEFRRDKSIQKHSLRHPHPSGRMNHLSDPDLRIRTKIVRLTIQSTST